ncbi:hypothetical protein UK23_23775 [Lentzea aerocolonigenes]|uniref:Deoxyribonuclease NucA/NucB domain-containing protein n=1 Tax=Lentzea aerocolonigenes TaxID=68170 RepID=A0A0F0GSQ6_LENAE|nr:NucA/NucB deoxyribonuclease domain-containing protein [Lentzea aerocolonigenes]KJK46340.1 hypothetical protein UK23_23775 [Lentzea aerocolonigenes]
MATKTGSGLGGLILVGALVALVATEPGQQILKDLGVTGEAAPADMLVPPDQVDRVKECTPEVLTKDKRCKNLAVLPVDAARMPNIALHTKLAWAAGHPALLHRGEVGSGTANRALACTAAVKAQYKPNSCDEYPHASSQEGGANASTAGVPAGEQRIQGGIVNATYSTNNLQPGDEFLVVILNTAKIPAEYAKG